MNADAIPQYCQTNHYQTANSARRPRFLSPIVPLLCRGCAVLQMTVVEGGFDTKRMTISQRTVWRVMWSSDQRYPLANDCIEKGAGSHLSRFCVTKNNIKQSSAMRDFMDAIRSTGVFRTSARWTSHPIATKTNKPLPNILNAWIR